MLATCTCNEGIHLCSPKLISLAMTTSLPVDQTTSLTEPETGFDTTDLAIAFAVISFIPGLLVVMVILIILSMAMIRQCFDKRSRNNNNRETTTIQSNDTHYYECIETKVDITSAPRKEQIQTEGDVITQGPYYSVCTNSNTNSTTASAQQTVSRENTNATSTSEPPGTCGVQTGDEYTYIDVPTTTSGRTVVKVSMQPIEDVQEVPTVVEDGDYYITEGLNNPQISAATDHDYYVNQEGKTATSADNHYVNKGVDTPRYAEADDDQNHHGNGDSSTISAEPCKDMPKQKERIDYINKSLKKPITEPESNTHNQDDNQDRLDSDTQSTSSDVSHYMDMTSPTPIPVHSETFTNKRFHEATKIQTKSNKAYIDVHDGDKRSTRRLMTHSSLQQLVKSATSSSAINGRSRDFNHRPLLLTTECGRQSSPLLATGFMKHTSEMRIRDCPVDLTPPVNNKTTTPDIHARGTLV